MKKNILAFLLLSFSLAHATPPEQPTVNPASSEIESPKASITKNERLLLNLGIGIVGMAVFAFSVFQLYKNGVQFEQTREIYHEKLTAFLINHAKTHPEYFALKTMGLKVNPPAYPQELTDLQNVLDSLITKNTLLGFCTLFSSFFMFGLPPDDNNDADYLTHRSNVNIMLGSSYLKY